LYKNKKALIPSPTFGEYDHLFLKTIKYNDKVGIEIKEIETNIKSSEVIVIVNPNNPTGSIISTDWIYKTAEKNINKLFIIDESFIEFSNEISIIDLLEKNELNNIIVIRSMSKNYGLPGVRLGFIYTCNNQLYDKILSNIPKWNLNSISEFYLEIILKNKIALMDSYRKTKRDREEFILGLKKIDLIEEVFLSEGNYILFSIKSTFINSADILNFLTKEYNIFIKDVTDKMNIPEKYFFRVAVRLPNENKEIISAISKFHSIKKYKL
jgi:histidinol-phosphate/aromatic aminotransferase/cobyric acid decarboxylase-like protein